MLRSLTQRGLLVALLLTATACTQPPAQVELMGQNNYGRDSSNSYAENNASAYAAYQPSAGPSSYANSGTYAHTDSTATIQSIGVSDLTPPPGKAPPANKWASAVHNPPTTLASATINPWTGAPRSAAASDALDQSFHLSPKGKSSAFGKEQMVADVQPSPAPAKTIKPATGMDTRLDSIVSNDTNAMQRDASPARKPKKTEVATSSGFMWPVNSTKIISEFGPKGNGQVNDGINIASAAGEPVWAAADGEVIYVGNELQGYGNMVIIKHSGNKTTTYAHLNRYTVDKYDRVKQGDIIGYVGTTGNVKNPQLHFAIRDGKDAVDPMKYLGQNVASLR